MPKFIVERLNKTLTTIEVEADNARAAISRADKGKVVNTQVMGTQTSARLAPGEQIEMPPIEELKKLAKPKKQPPKKRRR